MAAALVGVAAGKYNCPGSSAFFHASMEVTTFADHVSCDYVQAEIEARASGNWVDPHNGGIYSVLSSSTGLINTQRTTNPATSVGGTLYTDKQTFELTSIDGGCQIRGCSESQSSSVGDLSTNYCNLRNLYCGSNDGCTPAQGDLSTTEQSHRGSLGAGHDSSKCVVASQAPSAPAVAPVSEVDLTKYVGLWYQAYSSQSVVAFPEFGANCVTAEYGVASDGASVTVKNTVTLLGARVSVQGIAVQNPDVVGIFQAAIGAPGFPVTTIPTYTAGNFDNYLIVAVGPEVDGSYDWAVVSDGRQETLYVLTRDLAAFDKYEEEVLKLCEDLGFTTDAIKPVKSYQDKCSYSEQDTVVV